MKSPLDCFSRGLRIAISLEVLQDLEYSDGHKKDANYL
jgi:hypothetical protein